MAEILLEQTLCTTSTMEASTPYTFLGRLLSTKSSKLQGINGNIYSHMCQQLEPEQKGLPSETWNAAVDPVVQRLRYRSDSADSTESKVVVESPTFDVPRWSWPETKIGSTPLRRISEVVKPQ